METFGQATEIACREAGTLREDVGELQARWREQLEGLRSDAGAFKLIDVLPGRPVLTVSTAAEAVGVSVPAASRAIDQLEGRGIVRPLNARKWGRGWEASELVKLVEEFERRVSSLGNERR